MSVHRSRLPGGTWLIHDCLIDMLSGPICAMVWEGREAVKTGRGMSSPSLIVPVLNHLDGDN